MYGQPDIYGGEPVTNVDNLDDAIDQMVDERFGKIYTNAADRQQRIEDILDKLEAFIDKNKWDRVYGKSKDLVKLVTKIKKKDDPDFEPSSRLQAFLDYAGNKDTEQLMAALGKATVEETGETASVTGTSTDASGITTVHRQGESMATAYMPQGVPGMLTGNTFDVMLPQDQYQVYPGMAPMYQDGGDTYITVYENGRPVRRRRDHGRGKFAPGATGTSSAMSRPVAQAGRVSSTMSRPVAQTRTVSARPSLTSSITANLKGGSGVNLSSMARPGQAPGRVVSPKRGVQMPVMSAPVSRGLAAARPMAASAAARPMAAPAMGRPQMKGGRNVKFGGQDPLASISDPAWWQEKFGDTGLLDFDLVSLYSDEDEEDEAFGDVGLIDFDLISLYSDKDEEDDDENESFGDNSLLDFDLISLYSDEDEDDDDDILDVWGDMDFQAPSQTPAKSRALPTSKPIVKRAPRNAPLAGVRKP